MRKHLFTLAVVALGILFALGALRAEDKEQDVLVLVGGQVIKGHLDFLDEHSLEFAREGTFDPQPYNLSNVKSLTLCPSTVRSMTEVREYDRIIRKQGLETMEGNIAPENETEDKIFIFPSAYKSTLPIGILKKNILRIERKRGPLDIFNFKLRYAKLKGNDTPEGLYEVANWAAPYEELRPHIIELGKKIIDKNPSYAEAYLLLSDTYQAKREKEGATEKLDDEEIGIYRKASKNDVNSPILKLRLGRLLASRGLEVQAMEAFEAAAIEAEKLALASMVRTARMGRAGILMQRKKYTQAKIIYEDVLREEADNFAALVALGKCLVETGDYDEAEQRLLAAVEIESTTAEPFLALSRMRLIQSDLQGALDMVEKVLEIGTNGAEALTLKGLALARAGYFPEASARLSEALDAGGGVETHMAIGYLRENMKDYAGAADAYRTVIMLDNEMAAAYYHLASALLSVGDGSQFDEADRLLDSALKKGFDTVLTFELKSAIARARHNFEDAARYLRYAIAGRESADRYYALGLVMMRMGKSDEAEVQFKKALTLDERHDGALYGLGYILRNRENLEGALEYFKLALALKPDELRYKLAVERTRDTSSQEVWIDSFDRPDGDDAHRLWEEVEKYGVTIKIKNKRCVFEGTQRGDKADRTIMVRTEEMRKKNNTRFARFEARIDGSESEGARYGIRIEEKSHGAIVLAKDFDGRPIVYHRAESGEWSEPQQLDLPGFDPKATHNLAIEIADRKKGEFAIYVDNELVMTLKKSYLARSRNVRLGIYGQAPKDTPWKLTVEKVKIFWQKPVGSSDR